jgi:hypothetical protein
MSLPPPDRPHSGRICAVVINYFGSTKTQRCLESLARERLATIYVADNSTDDEERARLEGVVASVAAICPATKIDLVINNANLGFGRTINELIAHDLQLAKPHDYYLLINNDAELRQGATLHLAQALDTDPCVALVAPRLRTAHGTTDFFYYWRFGGGVSLRPHRLAFPYLTGCCLMVPRRFAATGALFDRAFFMYGEDVLLTWRVYRAGLKAAAVAQAEVLHEGTGSSRQGGLFYEYHVARGHVLLALKMTRHPAEVPLLLAGRAAVLLVRACLRALRYRTPAPILAYVLCWFDMDVRPPKSPVNGHPIMGSCGH